MCIEGIPWDLLHNTVLCQCHVRIAPKMFAILLIIIGISCGQCICTTTMANCVVGHPLHLLYVCLILSLVDYRSLPFAGLLVVRHV